MREIMNDMLVLKVGTSTLVHQSPEGTEQLDRASFGHIGRQIDDTVRSGRGVVLVSSGIRQRLPEVGWGRVVAAWEEALIAQTEDFLLLDGDFDSLSGHKLFACARMGKVAIVNDHPALPEGSVYRNNDIVAAALAKQIGQVLDKGCVQLGILSDVNGVLADVTNPDSVIRVIDDIDAYEHLANGTSAFGATGGMKTKFRAARIALEGDAETWIAHGRQEDSVLRALQGTAGTRFVREAQFS
jgi:glutamate 5-kinase